MLLVQQTILQFTVIVGLVFGLTWLMMAVVLGLTPRASKLFMLANFALVCGVVLTSLRNTEGGYVYFHLADWVTIGGFACLHLGLLNLVNADPPPALHSVFPMLLAMLVTVPFAPNPGSGTILSLALFGTLAWYTFTAFMTGMRGLDEEVFSKSARAGVSAPFFLMGLVLMGRTIDVLGNAIFGVAVSPSSGQSVIFVWAMVVFMLLANIALATLATGRLLMRIRALAEMDYLTGCLNRRSLEQRLKMELDRHLRSSEPLACVFFDLDHFKGINDVHGHEAGDAALKHTVRLIGDLLRSVDALGRFGGEEFLVLMPNTDLKGAADAANRMRIALTRTQLNVEGKIIPLSASFGATVLGRNERMDDFVRRADAAMYQAKRLGRNRVEVDASTEQQRDQVM